MSLLQGDEQYHGPVLNESVDWCDWFFLSPNEYGYRHGVFLIIRAPFFSSSFFCSIEEGKKKADIVVSKDAARF